MASSERGSKRLFLMFAFFNFALVVPFLLRTGRNVVTETYHRAALHILAGETPYGPPTVGADQFKYSPLFAWLYVPLTALPTSLEVLAWAALNVGVFWLGLWMWSQRLEKQTPSLPGWLKWVCLVLASMELDGSLRYQQVNALLAGCVLIAMALMTDAQNKKKSQKEMWGAAVLALAANLKILPFFLVALWVFTRRWRSLLTIGIASLACLAFPVLFSGVGRGVELLVEWKTLLLHDSSSQGLLDVKTVLLRIGASSFLAAACRWLIALGTAVWMALVAWHLGDKKMASHLGEKAKIWAFWVGAGLLCVLLINPRTESPTFVLGSVSYVLCAPCVWNLSMFRWMGFLQRGFFVAGAFFMTFSFNDLWPRRLWNPAPYFFATKTLGAGFLWLSCSVAAMYFLTLARRTSRQAPS